MFGSLPSTEIAKRFSPSIAQAAHDAEPVEP